MSNEVMLKFFRIKLQIFDSNIYKELISQLDQV